LITNLHHPKLTLIILSDNVSPRLQYITEFFFGIHWSLDFTLTTSVEEFLATDAIKINYTATPQPGPVVNIIPGELLFEKNTFRQPIKVLSEDGMNVFFRFSKDEDIYPFDIFAAAFYLLSRYEEYLPHTTDIHDRYAAENSLAFQHGFLKIPLVNIWLSHFEQFIKKRYSQFKPGQRSFKFLPTFDVDTAYEWNFNLIKNTRHFASLVKNKKSLAVRQSLNVITGKTKDPFDIFEKLSQLHEENRLHPIFFFLLANKNSIYDNNNPAEGKKMVSLINKLSKKFETGIHPSYYSENKNTLIDEKELLEKLSGNVIKKSRQHYLRFNLPATYRLLIESGITDDYSMGYGTMNGFRASYAGTFYWYDLGKEEKTNLKIHPFCYMDSNSIYYHNHSPEEALSELLSLFRSVKNVNELFIVVIHNHFMGRHDNEWFDVYKSFLKEISLDKN
jgi:hypothetical protein